MKFRCAYVLWHNTHRAQDWETIGELLLDLAQGYFGKYAPFCGDVDDCMGDAMDLALEVVRFGKYDPNLSAYTFFNFLFQNKRNRFHQQEKRHDTRNVIAPDRNEEEEERYANGVGETLPNVCASRIEREELESLRAKYRAKRRMEQAPAKANCVVSANAVCRARCRWCGKNFHASVDQFARRDDPPGACQSFVERQAAKCCQN